MTNFITMGKYILVLIMQIIASFGFSYSQSRVEVAFIVDGQPMVRDRNPPDIILVDSNNKKIDIEVNFEWSNIGFVISVVEDLGNLKGASIFFSYDLVRYKTNDENFGETYYPGLILDFNLPLHIFNQNGLLINIFTNSANPFDVEVRDGYFVVFVEIGPFALYEYPLIIDR